MDNALKIGVIGRIESGDLLGWFVFIKDDSDDSGGFLILLSKDPKMSKHAEGYDYWAEDKDTLVEMLKEFKWKIRWSEPNKELL